MDKSALLLIGMRIRNRIIVFIYPAQTQTERLYIGLYMYTAFCCTGNVCLSLSLAAV